LFKVFYFIFNIGGKMSLVRLFKRYFSEKLTASAKKSEIDLNQLTVVELKAMAKQRGLAGYSKLNKAGLIKLLR